MKESSARHVPILDGVRGLAIIAVLIFHLGTVEGDVHSIAGKLAVSAIDVGWLGVELFFALSGYLITGILLDSRGRDDFFRNFYIRRTLRIFPIYYVFLIVRFLVAPLISRSAAVEPRLQLWYWSYLCNWSESAGIVVANLSHLWSLAVEEQFYLIWPAVVLALPPRTLARTCGVVAVAALVARYLFAAAGMTEWAYLATVSRADALTLGALVAIVVRDPQWLAIARSRVRLLAGVAGAVLLAVVVRTHGFSRMNPLVQVVGYGCVSVLFALFILVCVSSAGTSWWRRALSSRALRSVGTYSYGMYIFHHPLSLVVYPHVRAWIVGRSELARIALSLAYIAAMSLATLGVACVSYHLVERRFLALKDKLAPRSHV